jgi:hypothetical protein
VIPAPTGHAGLARGFTAATPNSMPVIGPEPLGGNRGVLEAWDPVHQKLGWRTRGGGTLTTAGNLVFQATNDGHLFAYTPDKGEKLLDLAIGRFGAGLPITYLLDGKQYLAMLAGIGRARERALPGVRSVLRSKQRTTAVAHVDPEIREPHQLEDEVIHGSFAGVVGDENQLCVSRHSGFGQDPPDVFGGFGSAVRF